MSLRLPVRFAARQTYVSRMQGQQTRCFASSQTTTPEPAAAPGSPAEQMEQKGVDPKDAYLPHVSEEAAQVSQVEGERGPELQQGTKIQDIAKENKEVQQSLPKVMQDQIKKSQSGQQTRGYSTFAPAMRNNRVLGFRNLSTISTGRWQDIHSTENPGMDIQRASGVGLPTTASESQNSEIVSFFDDPIEEEEDDDDGDFEYEVDDDELEGGLVLNSGLKFDPVNTPLPAGSHLRRRYDTLVDQVTKLMMKDGKLSVAQRNMSIVLSHLRTSPAPHASTKYPLMPGAPPHSALPLNPVVYLGLAIDSVAPLFRLRSQRGAAGGGVALQLPVPLRQRQRRRTSVMWILDAVEKRKGGMSGFGKRFAEEIVSIVEGKSSCWAKREAVHGLSIRARANLTLMARGGGGRR